MNRRMENEMTTTNNQLTTPATSQVSLLEMRMDARTYPRIGAVSREAAIVEMSKIVTQAFLYKGQAADPTNIQFIACTLVDELQQDSEGMGSRKISFAEIARIVKRSILQDEMYGISVASLYKVIATYIKGEGKKIHEQALDAISKSEQEKMKRSVIAPMLQSYAGQLLKNSKV